MRVVCCGLTTLDLTYVVDEMPRADQKVTARSIRTEVGGPAANAARTALALGAEVRLVTALGSSPFADLARQGLEGIEVEDLAASEFEVPISSVVVDSQGQRQVVSRNAAGLTRTTPPRSVRGADAVLVDGHLMEAQIRVAREAQRYGVTVLFDGGSYKPGTEDLASLVDIAAVSADFTFPRGGDTLRRLLDLGADLALQTRGARPIVVESVRGRKWVPVPQVEVVDTLGAGDVFHGALTVAFARGDRPLDAVEFASGIAARSVQAPGALGWAASP
ncbi:MAG: PfkB family carbohydrate kinase [bacterium]|nr:PfkB family carbohydrate kinase [bacterium]